MHGETIKKIQLILFCYVNWAFFTTNLEKAEEGFAIIQKIIERKLYADKDIFHTNEV